MQTFAIRWTRKKRNQIRREGGKKRGKRALGGGGEKGKGARKKGVGGLL